MSLVPEKLGSLMFKIGSFCLKRRRSRDRSKKEILIDITGLGICCQHFLEIRYGYQTGENREPEPSFNFRACVIFWACN